MNIQKIRELKFRLSDEQKKKLLVGLHKLKEGYAGLGNSGAFGMDNTDIVNADNLQVSENEFTSGDTQPSPNVIAKTFDTKADFDSYVNQRRGIEMTPKEMQVLSVMKEAALPSMGQRPVQQTPPPQEPEETTADDTIRIQKSNTFMDDTQGADVLSNFLSKLELADEKPTHGDKFFIRYEVTDEFGNNTTTVIKKLKEGNQFCWTAFSKYESAKEEGNPKTQADEES